MFTLIHNIGNAIIGKSAAFFFQRYTVGCCWIPNPRIRLHPILFIAQFWRHWRQLKFNREKKTHSSPYLIATPRIFPESFKSPQVFTMPLYGFHESFGVSHATLRICCQFKVSSNFFMHHIRSRALFPKMMVSINLYITVYTFLGQICSLTLFRLW